MSPRTFREPELWMCHLTSMPERVLVATYNEQKDALATACALLKYATGMRRWHVSQRKREVEHSLEALAGELRRRNLPIG